ncbi:hypothetical protein HPG69_018934 [Diceros bicornis minor]|uniref:G-protein coupled receptors family 1 profile domain-containing protein n=1 Tax=Diceros bicornis minor TaxID=77932 RepID=A0A7J7F9Z6_DICBM|nr:hypothetical protein HPG69_018934 [Diceros bicornis minor]
MPEKERISMSTGEKTITHNVCTSPLFFLIFLMQQSFFLLAIVSYGRYAAICKPLHYVTIMSSRAILKFPPAQQRKMSLSNCSSHVIVVFIAYESCIFNYIKPSSKGVDLNKCVSVLTASIAPVLYPFI